VNRDYQACAECKAQAGHHEDEVRQSWRVHGASSARAHNNAELWHNATCHHVALKHLGITSKTVNTLLNARAAAIVEANDRNTSFHGSIHNFADFLGVHLA
jgi:hypothetical protein